jgi:hypothetical protein
MSTTTAPNSKRRYAILGGLACLLLLVVAYRVLRAAPSHGERSYWYDVSEKRLYTGPKDLVPPQDGVGGASGDAYLATVISWKKDGSDKTVAFLISYTDELHSLLEQQRDAKAQGQPPPEKLGDRLWVTANTLVRTPDSAQWQPKSSPAGQRILAVLTTRGPGGDFPQVCSPDD